MPTTLAELLAELREEQVLDEHKLTEALLDAVLKHKRDEAKQLLHPAVFAYVQQSERTRKRDLEREAFKPTRPQRQFVYQEPDGSLLDEPTVEYVNPAQDAMQKLLDETVFIPGEGMVAWGLVTVEFHQRRIAYLEEKLAKHIAGARDTIGRHEEAITVLRDGSCDTFNEYADKFGAVPVTAPEG